LAVEDRLAASDLTLRQSREKLVDPSAAILIVLVPRRKELFAAFAKRGRERAQKPIERILLERERDGRTTKRIGETLERIFIIDPREGRQELAKLDGSQRRHDVDQLDALGISELEASEDRRGASALSEGGFTRESRAKEGEDPWIRTSVARWKSRESAKPSRGRVRRIPRDAGEHRRERVVAIVCRGDRQRRLERARPKLGIAALDRRRERVSPLSGRTLETRTRHDLEGRASRRARRRVIPRQARDEP